MKHALAVTCLLLAAEAAFGQSTDKDQSDNQKYSGHAYAFWSLAQPFDNPGTGMAVGGGGEGFLYKGLSLGGELAYLFPTRYPSSGIGLASVNPGYHFFTGKGGGKLVPFVTGGYSLGFRQGVGHFFNYGGGVTYWFSRRVGLRLELRDHRYIPYPSDSFVTFRVGVSFR